MGMIRLSTGATLAAENIEIAEYVTAGSLRSHAMVTGILSYHDRDFLYIQTVNGSIHVCGNGAAEDANALELAGIRVYRRPSIDSDAGNIRVSALKAL